MSTIRVRKIIVGDALSNPHRNDHPPQKERNTVFETNIAVVGNVLTAPEWRRTTTHNQLVANFRVASTARRFDRETNRWIDGDVLRIRVTAWRRLAEGVASSITVGDPVVVYGRIFTRDWIDDDNNNRVSYEMEALAVGHDLARGRTRLYRNKPVPQSTLEGPDSETVVRGEPTDALLDGEAPVRFGDGMPDEVAPTFLEVVAGIVDEAAETVAQPDPTSREPIAA
ncbi:single-stranded DNA-binding protein [Actinoplanes derwentensis]|uniref:single-stranded DNA-binding protein n=1 Tax=Actinoplanes derwentensis TaxID=113562 RepID=UPI001E65D361|nr:single-stranded DNA-binding protein [Actinoplanes derwentensis]